MALPVRRRDQGRQTTRSPTVWEPFRELDEIQRRTAELIDSVWSGGARATDDLPWVPAVDVEETDDAWIIEAEVPGVRREDVDVEVRDSELVVSGEIVERERAGAPGAPGASSTAWSSPSRRTPGASTPRSRTAC